MDKLFAFWHQLAEFYHLFIMKFVPQCPNCGNVGLWRPIGGWISRVYYGDNRGKRRWLCKMCGYYVDEDGYDKAICHPKRNTWALMSHLAPDQDPKECFTMQSVWMDRLKDLQKKNTEV